MMWHGKKLVKVQRKKAMEVTCPFFPETATHRRIEQKRKVKN